MLSAGACKKWDNHIAVNEQALNVNLMEQINATPGLTKLREYLVKTGLDKEIISSKTYTVFAPTDNALQALPASVVNDTAQLRAFLLNHISGQLFFTGTTTDTVRVPMLNGKRVALFNKSFDDATITQPDVYVRNGVLQVIDKVVAPLPSVWEFITATQNTYNQNAYVASLNYLSQDPAKAELDSINPVTGEPVYKPNTGIVQINTFRTKVYDVANEDSLFTYVLLTNTAFSNEIAKQAPYFKSTDAAITTSNASWNIVKDFAIRGLYSQARLPSVLKSKFGVDITMNQASIVEVKRASNGIVYIVSDAPTTIAQKIPAVIIQGENPFSFSSYDSKYTTKTFYRQRLNPLTGQSFRDLYLNLGSSGANYYVDYLTNDLYTTTYKVYWVALNDKTASGQGDDAYGTDSTLQQILKIGPSANPYTSTFSVQSAVRPITYTEIYLGDYTNSAYDFLLAHPTYLPDGTSYIDNPATRKVRLQAPASATTGIPLNLTLDYIKFVPVP